jgi:serine phosphatase RsbU (regulator of sigma subunit)
LYILRNNELIVLKPTINPVGIFIKELPFENHKVELQKDDILMMFTDGLIDQFNAKGEKFKLKRFRDIILNNQGLNLSDRKRILEDAFLAWKENTSQIDDVLVIALKIK